MVPEAETAGAQARISTENGSCGSRSRSEGAAVPERSDEYIVGRLIERSRPPDRALGGDPRRGTKLQTQPLLKQLAAGARPAARGAAGSCIRGTYAAPTARLVDYADLEALLSAMKTFLPYL